MMAFTVGHCFALDINRKMKKEERRKNAPYKVYVFYVDQARIAGLLKFITGLNRGKIHVCLSQMKDGNHCRNH